MTYYGYRVRFHFTFECGCTSRRGSIYQKFAYQYAGLGAPQRCELHDSPEVSRYVERVDGPHGEWSLGWWTAEDGTRIFVTWEPSSKWVFVDDETEDRYVAGRHKRPLVRIDSEETIWRVVGGDHLGGDRPEPAAEILARLRAAAS